MLFEISIFSTKLNILSEDLEGATTGSSINAPGGAKSLSLGKILEDIDTFFHENPDYIKGKSKSTKPKFNLVDYMKNYNLIIYDHLIKKNKDLPAEQKFLIKVYFDAMLKLYDILGVFRVMRYFVSNIVYSFETSQN